MVKSDDKLFVRFVNEVTSVYGNNLKSIILYGSVARGTAGEESDVDIALIIENENEEMYDKLLDIVVAFELEYNIVITTVLIETALFEKWRNVSPFYKNITNEGIELWKAA